MSTIATLLAKVNQTVLDTASIFDDDKNQLFIIEAVRQYSRDKPLRLDAIVSGTGSASTFATASGWTDGFSVILSVESPIDQEPEQLLDLQDSIQIVLRSGVEKWQFIDFQMSASETARVQFTLPHTADGVRSTIPSIDEDAVSNLAASKLARALAAYYAESTDGTLADVVDHTGKAAVFQALANDLRAMYKEHVIAGEIETGVLTHHDLDVNFSWGGDLLFHPRRFR